MRLFTVKNVYNRETGKKETEIREDDKVLCDYTGEIIDLEDNYEYRLAYNIQFDYDDICECEWEEDNVDDLIKLLKPKGLDQFNLKSVIAESPFHYSVNTDYSDKSKDLMRDWINGNPFLLNCSTIAQAARIWRLNLIINILENKKLTAEELGLYEN